MSQQSDNQPIGADDDRVLRFAEWCRLNSFSIATGRRIIAAGTGPRIIELSARRVGIRVRDNREWQAKRVR
jgi:predicted DNA-binding transcriptional regulator AlpA